MKSRNPVYIMWRTYSTVHSELSLYRPKHTTNLWICGNYARTFQIHMDERTLHTTEEENRKRKNRTGFTFMQYTALKAKA